MRLSTWYPALSSWLQKYITVSSWHLANPRSPGQTYAVLPPMRDLEYQSSTLFDLQGTGVQDIYVSMRYPEGTKYHQLPHGAIAGLYQSLAIRLVTDYAAITELTDLDVLPTDDAITVEEPGEKQDWLVTLHWAFKASWMAQPEIGFGGLDDTLLPFPVKEVDVGLWRDRLDDTGSILDATLEVRGLRVTVLPSYTTPYYTLSIPYIG